MAAETGLTSAAPSAAAPRARATAPLARGYTAPPAPLKPPPPRRRSARKRSPGASDDAVPGVARRRASPPEQPPAWARAALRAAHGADGGGGGGGGGGASSAPAPAPPVVQAVPGARLRRGDVVRAALRVLRAGRVPPDAAIAARVPAALVGVLVDPRFAAPADRVSAIAAVHAVASADAPRAALVAAGACAALVAAARDAARAQDLSVKAAAARGPVWTAAVRTAAKLIVCAPAAAADAISSGALALLAAAALPEEDPDVRARAAAGLAAIAAWSGPRRAVAIVETPDVVRAMSALLTDRDPAVSNHLRSATMDGLVAMSFHRRARRILRESGVEEKITAAARHASMSGDYDIAARGTVAAGKLTGRSVDEFGFFVDPGADTPDAAEDDDAAVDSRDSTGLRRIQEMLAGEAFMQVEEISALEMIVAEDADSGAESPRERQLVRDAARMYGVDGEQPPAAKLPLERAGSPTSPTDSSSRKTSREHSLHNTSLDLPRSATPPPPASSRSSSSARSSPRPRTRSGSAGGEPIGRVTPANASPASSAERLGRGGGGGGAGARVSVDPDDEAGLHTPGGSDDGGDEKRTSSARRVRMSPLLMFSMGTKRAAELDGAGPAMRKSASQLDRDVEHERVWRDVLDNHPELLARGEGTMRRVHGYRELATVPVPPALRTVLWPALLGVSDVRARQPGLYARLCAEGAREALSDEAEHTIEADVTRTMPHHALFWAGGAQVGVKSLRSILRAYARYRPEVGYCQGMSSVAAVFMMNARDEEDAFIMFVQFMEHYQYTAVFAQGFPQMLEWLEEVRPLIYHYMPDLALRLEKEGVPLELYADKWLITALSHNFPHRYLLRIWDLMFLGGSPKIILKSCLAVLKSCEQRLLTMDFEGMMHLLQRDFAKPEEGVLDHKDPEPFVKMARDFRFVANPNKPPPPVERADGEHTSMHAPPPGARPSRVRACFCFRASPTID